MGRSPAGQEPANRPPSRAASCLYRSAFTLRDPLAAVALYFLYYNFGRVHQMLRLPPAMEAGIAEHTWPIQDTVAPLKHSA
jgi:hypothetical protein